MKLFCFFIVFIVSGCASIPLSTMLKFSSYQKSDFVAIKPADIRAKIILDQPIEIDIEKVELGLEVETEQGDRVFKFPLSLLERRAIPAKEGWFAFDEAKNEYILNLSAESVQNRRFLHVADRRALLAGSSLVIPAFGLFDLLSSRWL